MSEDKGIAVLFCAPLSEYPTQPKDYSKSELVDCPTCNEKMWLSEKKKDAKQFSELIGREIIFECFICFKNRVKKDPEFWKDHTQVNI